MLSNETKTNMFRLVFIFTMEVAIKNFTFSNLLRKCKQLKIICVYFRTLFATDL